MTDIQCPACGHAFWRQTNEQYTPTHQPPHPHHSGSEKIDTYDCRNCEHTLIIRLDENTHIENTDNQTVFQCIHNDCTAFTHIWHGTTMDGDTEHAYQCNSDSACRYKSETAYAIRTCDPNTATGSEYDDENRFIKLRPSDLHTSL